MHTLAMAVTLGLAATDAAPMRTLIEWTFEQDGQLDGWQPNAYLTDVRVQGGLLHGKATGRDPFFTSPLFDVPTRPWQELRLRIKCKEPGRGAIFWSNTTESPYGGFRPKKHTPYRLAGGDKWEIVRVQPAWLGEGKIIHVRLDIDRPCDFAIDWIRIVEPEAVGEPTQRTSWDFRSGETQGWSGNDVAVSAEPRSGLRVEVGDPPGTLRSPPLTVALTGCQWLTLRMRSRTGRRASVTQYAQGKGDFSPIVFPLRSDGRLHTYNIDIGHRRLAAEKLVGVELWPSHLPGDHVDIESIRLSKAPQGPPDLEVTYFGMEDGVNRVGRPRRVMLRITNHGAETAVGVRGRVSFPPGVRVLEAPDALSRGLTLELDVPQTLWFELVADKPLDDTAMLQLNGPGAPPEAVRAPVRITPPPAGLTTGGIPEPEPAQTDYLIGTYYYPAWENDLQWRQVERFAPGIKPVLGYYDEDNPEVVDWQIKWYVERGVRFFLVDWYWEAGRTHHTHYVPAFQKARFRRHFKWAIMWANHNRPQTHSKDDWVKVTQYWLGHYLDTPEYLRIDGKPAVFIWSPMNIVRDVGGSEQAADLLALSQEMAREAGLPGITFVSMRALAGPDALAQRRQEGYTHATSYHWWSDAMGRADDPKRFPYSLVGERSRPGWDKTEKAVEEKGLTFIPVADTGWDARPRHGERTHVIYERTPELFERVLRDAKHWLDARGERMLILAPCNEWTEGSYIEPCTEFGFGMLDAVRKVFCGPGSPPSEVTPNDVGLGPYDFPIHERTVRTSWTFDRQGDPAGWHSSGSAAIEDFSVADGALTGVMPGHWSSLASPALAVRASRYPYLVLRLTTDTGGRAGGRLRVTWTTATTPNTRPNYVEAPLKPDGGAHTYVLHLAETPRWRGLVDKLVIRFYTGGKVTFRIEEVRLSQDRR